MIIVIFITVMMVFDGLNVGAADEAVDRQIIHFDDDALKMDGC